MPEMAPCGAILDRLSRWSRLKFDACAKCQVRRPATRPHFQAIVLTLCVYAPPPCAHQNHQLPSKFPPPTIPRHLERLMNTFPRLSVYIDF
ncbi:hypothetical protein PHLCEN_2v4456 [Hermanssonia centrifuga]|uniref:Uncharacterized protein n=1 Tax=Hermanssonia centrifuga TaxID=98765 RepID=A0A2R6PNR1_9APHY|nr:hypothetical protein PHLCEN_2v4456 [Hermanssonia centrifuga]